jgi:hypothetical protein
MGISGLSNNVGFFNTHSNQRIRQDAPPVSGTDKVNEISDQQHASKNSADEQPRPSLSLYRSHIPAIDQYQRYASAESVNGDNIGREPGMSRYSLYAISAYQSTENQEKRDQIEKMLGFDLYV